MMAHDVDSRRERPVDLFYRVRFADGQVLGEWSLRVLEVLSARDDVGTTAAGARPVVFIPLKASRGGTVYGYVSEAAVSLVGALAQGVELDGTTMRMRELPDWLGLLIGAASDATAYERRDLGDM
jgi:hypothetical protein